MLNATSTIRVPERIQQFNALGQQSAQKTACRSTNGTIKQSTIINVHNNNLSPKNSPITPTRRDGTTRIDSSFLSSQNNVSSSIEVKFRLLDEIKKTLNAGIFSAQLAGNQSPPHQTNSQNLYCPKVNNELISDPEATPPISDTENLLSSAETLLTRVELVHSHDEKNVSQRLNNTNNHPLRISAEKLEEYKSEARNFVRDMRDGNTKSELIYFMRSPEILQKKWDSQRFNATNKTIGSWQKFKDANFFKPKAKIDLAMKFQTAFSRGQQKINPRVQDLDALITKIKTSVINARGDEKTKIACSIVELQGMLSKTRSIKVSTS